MAENQQPSNPFLDTANLSPTGRATVSSPTPAPSVAPQSAFTIRPAATITSGKVSSPPAQGATAKAPLAPSMARPTAPSSSVTANQLADDFDVARKWRIARVIAAAVLVILVAGGLYWWWQARSVATPEAVSPPTDTTTPAPLPSVGTAGEPIAPTLAEDTALYRSEHFKAGEIVLLGEAELLSGDEGIAPLSLEEIRGEAFTEKNKQEVKLVISWKTNKLSTAEVSYAKGIGQTPKVAAEGDLAYNHSLILTGLDPASTYLYTVKATDRFGTTVSSEPYAVFTGARSVSLFDLIAGAIGEVFGWAVK